MKRAARAAAMMLLSLTTAFAHRLDEYLQRTLVSVGAHRLEAEMTLTPGVAVFPFLIRSIDTDGNGTVSDAEQRAYAERVLRDISLSLDGHRLTPRLSAMRFPAMDEMKEGRGEIRLEFAADLPPGGRDRVLTLENRHQRGISAYLVNCLAPRDPAILISAQNRNYSQSSYRLEYSQIGEHAAWPLLRELIWLGPVMLLLFIRLVLVLREPRTPERKSVFSW
jgi:hypothetical protein